MPCCIMQSCKRQLTLNTWNQSLTDMMVIACSGLLRFMAAVIFFSAATLTMWHIRRGQFCARQAQPPCSQSQSYDHADCQSCGHTPGRHWWSELVPAGSSQTKAARLRLGRRRQRLGPLAQSLVKTAAWEVQWWP